MPANVAGQGSKKKMSKKRDLGDLEAVDEEDESIGPMPDEASSRKKPKGYINRHDLSDAYKFSCSGNVIGFRDGSGHAIT